MEIFGSAQRRPLKTAVCITRAILLILKRLAQASAKGPRWHSTRAAIYGRAQRLTESSSIATGKDSSTSLLKTPRAACDRIRFIQSSSIAKRSEEHTSELQSLAYLVCRLLLEQKIYSDIVPTSQRLGARLPTPSPRALEP